MTKRIFQRDLLIEIHGPLILVGGFGFEIKVVIENEVSKPIYNSISDGVKPIKTLNKATEMASFAGCEINKIIHNYKDQPTFFQSLRELTEKLNVSL